MSDGSDCNASPLLNSPERSVVAGWVLPAFGAIGLPKIEFNPQSGYAGMSHPAATNPTSKVPIEHP
jgi:hypothetical protein